MGVLMGKMDVHFSSVSAEWETPVELYGELDAYFHFTLDPAATHLNHKCKEYFTIEDDGLKRSWEGHTVFCNPPYGRGIGQWIKKGYNEACKPATTVVMLIPNRTDTKWYHRYVKKGEIYAICGRLRFINRALPSYREEPGTFKVSPAPFPSAIVVFGGWRASLDRMFPSGTA